MKWYQKILLSFIISVLFYNLVNTQQILYVSSAGTGTSCTLSSPCSLSQVFGLTSDSDIVTLLSGTYEITSSITITSNNLLINSYTSPQTTILTFTSSNSSSTIFNIESQNVTMDSLSFTNSNVNTLFFRLDGSVANCYFTNITVTGQKNINNTVIYFNQNGSINNSIFLNCSTNQYASTSFGGVIYIKSSGIISQSNFTNCKSYGETSNQYPYGGVIFIQENGTISDSNFDHCKCTCSVNQQYTSVYGGVIYISQYGRVTNSTFTSCAAIASNGGHTYPYSYGGAVYINKDAIIDGSTFDSCYTSSSTAAETFTYGGALYIKGNATITHSNFNYCYSSAQTAGTDYEAGSVGGAVYINSGGIFNSTFIGCYAYSSSYFVASSTAGAIYLKLGGEISECSFSGCYAASYAYFPSYSAGSSGGALCTSSYQVIILTDSSFNNCSATSSNIYTFGISSSSGGAISIYQGNVTNCNFSDCFAYSTGAYSLYTGADGGAIFSTYSIEVVNTKLSGSSSQPGSGGALYAYDCSFINSSIVHSNTTHEGILYAANNLEIFNSTFSENLGGSVVYHTGNASISLSTFTQNNVFSSDDLATTALISSNSSAVITNCSFSYNTLIYSHNCMGIVYLRDGGMIGNSTFSNNGVYNCIFSYSAAIYQEGANFELSDCIFQNNLVRSIFTASSKYPTIYSTSLFNLTQLTFSNNVGDMSLVYFDLNRDNNIVDSTIQIDRCYFENNSVTSSLTTFSNIQLEKILVTNSQFSSNLFEFPTNFIAINSTDLMVFDSCIFQDNTNGIFSFTTQFLLSNSNIQNNEAIESLFQIDGSLTIINSNFSENVISVEGYSTDINGGVLYCGANGECNIIQSNFNKNLLSGGNNCQGTVIYSNNYLNISDTTFNENINNCLNSYGGAISISKSISNTTQLIEISNTSFQSNSLDSQTGYGGAIYSEIAFNIENLSFINNSITGESLKSAYGAAVYFQDNSNDNNINQQEISSQSPILFSQTNFISNFIETSTEVSNSEYSGAAISFSTTKNILISNCTFEENFISMKVSFLNFNTISSVGLSGVAISSLFSNDSSSNLDPSMTIINSSFIENSITAEGCSKYTIIGGLINSGSFNLMINDSNFRDNQMTWGTNSPFIIGMLLYSNNSISMDQSQFQNNTGIKLNNICEESVANIVQGGNVYCNKVLSSNSNYINNQINGDIIEGGIIWMRSGSFNNSLFQSNICSTQSISFSSAGGCIWISSTSNINSSTLENTLFLNNTADYGAGYCIGEFGSYPMIHNVSMQNNNATESGSVYIMNNLLNEWLNCSDLTGSTANNTSEYGIDCGSTASELSFYSSIPIFIYPSQVFQVELYLNDWFESLIDNSLYRVNLEETTYLSVGVENQYSVPSVNGIFSYQYLTFYSPVGSNNSLVFTAQPNNNNINNNNNNNATHSLLNNRIFTQNIILQTISCPPTTYYLENNSSNTTTGVAECISCGSNQYSFDGLSCLNCPILDDNLKGSDLLTCISASSPIVQNNNTIFEMVINEGWWPNSFVNPSYLIACPYSNSCKNITCFITLNLLYSPSNNSGNNNNSSIDNGYGWIINCESCNSTSPYNNYYYNENNNNNDNEGGESSCYCNEGYQEYLCSECVCDTLENCFYLSNEECNECEIFSIRTYIAFFILFILLIFLLFIFVFMPKFSILIIIFSLLLINVMIAFGIITWYISAVLIAILLVTLTIDQTIPKGIDKLFLYYIQVIISIVPITSWPSFLKENIQSMEIVDFNFSFFACISLSFAQPFNLFLFSILLVPILGICLTIVLLFDHFFLSKLNFILRFRSKFVSKVNNNNNNNIIVDINNDRDLVANENEDKDKYGDGDGEDVQTNLLVKEGFDDDFHLPNNIENNKISLVLITRLLSLAYYPLALLSLSVLSCENGYMKEYQWIECNSSSDYIYFVILSSIVILLYVIGYPVCLCIILILYRLSYRSFTIIFDNYKVKADYFEILFICKKLSIIILLTLFTGFIQKILLSSVLLIGIILQYFIAPFKSRALNKLQLLVEIVILFSSIFSSLNSFYNLSDATFLFWSWAMSIINLFVLLLFLLILVRSHWIFAKITSKFRMNYTIL